MIDWTEDYLNARASLMQFYDHASHGEKEMALEAIHRAHISVLLAQERFANAPIAVRWK